MPLVKFQQQLEGTRDKGHSPVQVEGGNLGVVALVVREVEMVGQRLLVPRKPAKGRLQMQHNVMGKMSKMSKMNRNCGLLSPA